MTALMNELRTTVRVTYRIYRWYPEPIRMQFICGIGGCVFLLAAWALS